MKIAMIGQKGIPTLFGGVERHVEEISCRLARKKDYSVFVYTRGYYTPRDIKEYRGVNLIHVLSLKTKHLDAISHALFSTFHAMFKLKADVIHFHGVGPALCLWIPKLFYPQTKVVFTFHCQDYYHQKWGSFARFSLKLGEIIGCRFADEVIPVSKELENYVKKSYRRRSKFIPHGINPEEQRSDNLIKQWELSKNSYVLTVSRLIPHKGIHYLLKAYSQIKTDKKLVIVGPSFYTKDYEEKLKKMAKADKRVIFLGSQYGEVLKQLYSNAFVFVNPSEQEGLPLVVLEAASFGKPLLLSGIPIHKTVFEDLPFFFRNKSPKNLKDNLEALLNNPQLAYQRARKIKSYSIKNYNWDRTVENITLKYA